MDEIPERKQMFFNGCPFHDEGDDGYKSHCNLLENTGKGTDKCTSEKCPLKGWGKQRFEVIQIDDGIVTVINLG